MSDLLHSVSQARKTLQRKRQLRNREISMISPQISKNELMHSSTEKTLRIYPLSLEKSDSNSSNIKSPLPKRFDFRSRLLSPQRLRTYKLDAAILLSSRLCRFLNKHFLIWKKNTESLRKEETNIFNQKAWRLKVSISKMDFRPREISEFNPIAGKIIRKPLSGIMSPYRNFSSQKRIQFNASEDSKKKSLRSFEDSYGSSPSSYHSHEVNEASEVAKKKKLESTKDLALVINNAIIYRKNYGFHCISMNVRIRSTGVDSESKSRTENTESHSRLSENSSEKSAKKDYFENTLENIKKYINDKRDKLKKKLLNKHSSSILYEKLLKVDHIISKSLYRIAIEALKMAPMRRNLDLCFKIKKYFETLTQKFLSHSFELIYQYPSLQKGKIKILQRFMKNMNKDVNHRVSMCFKCWRLNIKNSKSHKEMSSLSAVTIHNMLLHIINCRTKIFFATYKLALIKFQQFNREKFIKISKAVNQLSLCLRDYKLKPFIKWKYSTSAYRLNVTSKAQDLTGLERSLNKIVHSRYYSFFEIFTIFYKQPLIYKEPKGNFSEDKGKLFKSNKLNPKVLRKFSYRYMCVCLNRMTSDIVFHQSCLKKNTVVKWRLKCMNQLVLSN